MCFPAIPKRKNLLVQGLPFLGFNYHQGLYQLKVGWVDVICGRVIRVSGTLWQSFMCYVTYLQCLNHASWWRNASVLPPVLQLNIWVLGGIRSHSWLMVEQDLQCTSLLLLIITWPTIQELRKVLEMGLLTRDKKRTEPIKGEREMCSSIPLMMALCSLLFHSTWPHRSECQVSVNRKERRDVCTWRAGVRHRAGPIYAILPKETFTLSICSPFSLKKNKVNTQLWHVCLLAPHSWAAPRPQLQLSLYPFTPNTFKVNF